MRTSKIREDKKFKLKKVNKKLQMNLKSKMKIKMNRVLPIYKMKIIMKLLKNNRNIRI
jgi:hypothetical protein